VLWPQDRDDLLQLVGTIRAIQAGDETKAPVCLQLLAKLHPYLGHHAEAAPVGAAQRDHRPRQ
jgi:hypothetical protein